MFLQSTLFKSSAIIGIKTRFSLDLGYSMFDLQAGLPSSVYLLSRDIYSSASEIPLPEEINRRGYLFGVVYIYATHIWAILIGSANLTYLQV